MLHVHPVAHETCQFLPFLGVLHHLTATSRIVVSDTDALADVFLGDPEGLLYA